MPGSIRCTTSTSRSRRRPTRTRCARCRSWTGRYRAHGSQHGNALLAVIRLGLVDDRAPRLVERLLHWQWPDGGWNCDRDPAADTSSFMETLPPMRALAAWCGTHRRCRGGSGGRSRGRGLPRAPPVPASIERPGDPLGVHEAPLPALLALRPARRPQGDGRARPDRRPALRRRARPARVEAAARRRLAGRGQVLQDVRRRSRSATTTSTGAARARAARTRGSPWTRWPCYGPADGWRISWAIGTFRRGADCRQRHAWPDRPTRKHGGRWPRLSGLPPFAGEDFGRTPPSECHFVRGIWSGRPDLNRRPPVPQTGALPDCATPRQVGQSSTRGPGGRPAGGSGGRDALP